MATTYHVAVAAGIPATGPGDDAAKTGTGTAAGKALVVTLALRLFYSLFAAVSAPYLSLNPSLIRGNSLTGQLIPRDSHPLVYALLGVWERFDTLWYLQIARHGYDNAAATVFYPVYPALIRAVSWPISWNSHSDLLAALLISTVSSFFLFWGAMRLFELDSSPDVAMRALVLWMTWPASFAFFAGYPDSLLCALTIWSLYFARSARCLPAGALGLLAALTKALGCLTVLPLLWIAWKRRSRRAFVSALLPLAGVASFQGWLAIHHFPPPVQVYRASWATITVFPWTTAVDAAHALTHGPNLLLILNAAVFVAVGSAAMLPAVPFGYKLYAAAALCLFLTKHTEPLLQSTTRYSLAVFAAYPALSAKLGAGLSFVSVAFLAAIVNLFLLRTFLDWGLVI